MRANDELINNRNKMSRQRILELQKKINSKNDEFKIQIDNIKKSRETTVLQNEIDKLNNIISDIKDYAHSYLTYAMMNFVFKYEISKGTSEYDILKSEENCKNYNQEEECNSNIYCIYNDSSHNNITKGEFYKREANNLNETIKKYFGNNKL